MTSKKDFKSNNPLANLLQKQKPSDVKTDGAAGDVKIEVEAQDQEQKDIVPVESEESKTDLKPKKRAGRKKTKTEPQKAICIEIPESVFANVEIAKQCYNNNLTRYINALITRDLEKNLDSYKTIVNSLAEFN